MTPAVGRAAEMEFLRDLYRRAVGGAGSFVTIAGPAGIGKTTLAAALADEVRAVPATVAWTGCAAGGVPFGAWAAVLDELSPGATIEGSYAPGTNPEDVRRTLVIETLRHLRDATAEGPVLIVIDDVQWLDPSGRSLTAEIATRLGSTGVMVVATERVSPGAPGVGLPGERLELGALGEDDARVLVEGIAGADAVPEIVRRAGGHPLFLVELARFRRTGTGAGFPRRVGDIVRLRVGALGPDAARGLEVASALGQEFDVVELAAACDERHDEVRVWIDEAIAADLIRVEAPGRAAFVHDVVREVVEAGVPLSRRVTIHEAIARVLETRGAPPARLLRHWRWAERPDRVVPLAKTAGDRSMEAAAYEDAVSQYREGIDAVGDPGSEGAVDLLLGLGDALVAVGDLEAARSAFTRAATGARGLGRDDMLARAALGIGSDPAGFEVSVLDHDQIAVLDEALAGSIDRAMRARLSARLSVAVSSQGDHERTVALARSAVEEARASADESALASALAAWCDAMAGPDHIDERREAAGSIVEIGRRIDSRAELLGLRLRAVAAWESGDFVAADRDVERYAQVASRLRQPLYEWYVPLWRAMRSAMKGEWQAASRWADVARATGERAGSRNAAVLVMTYDFSSLHDFGRTAEFRSLLDTIEFPESGALWEAVSQAMFHALTGDSALARRLYDGLTPRLRSAVPDSEWLPMLSQIAESLVHLGPHSIASVVRSLLAPYADSFVIEGIGAYTRGSAHRHLGIVTAVDGDLDRAAAHFDAAVEANAGVGASLLVAATLEDAGRVLDDRARLDAALDLFRSLNLEGRVAGVERLLGRRAAPERGAAPASLVFDGAEWTAIYEGQSGRVRDLKGVGDLAVLLQRPGVEVSAIEIASRDSGGEASELDASGDLGPVLDATARARYREALVDLEDTIAEAVAFGDLSRASAATAERDFIVAELTAAHGLSGRARRAGDPAEKARTTVTARIRYAIDRIEAVHPRLAAHLRVSVSTGVMCEYRPETPVEWTVDSVPTM